jgi:2-C-methyl-D-erythritol 4-phosphate cytidylyltransferase
MDGVIVTAAGRSERFGTAQSKLLALLGGRTVLEHSLLAVRAALPEARLVVTAPAEHLAAFAAAAAKAVPGGAAVVAGGASRQESVARGLAALAAGVTHVLVHDAARPLASPALFRRVRDAVHAHGAALAGLPSADTIHRLENAAGQRLAGSLDRGVLDRSALYVAQTPQGARAEWLRGALARAAREGLTGTDEAGLLVADGRSVVPVQGEPWNVKLTRPDDLRVLEALLPLRA